MFPLALNMDIKFSAAMLLIVLVTCIHCEGCRNFSELEHALYHGEENIEQLSKAFFPSTDRTSRFIEIHYKFIGNGTDNCTVIYFWAVGGFLLIQPPQIFQYTSLLLDFPSNNITDITLTLPPQCHYLVYNEDKNCSCKAEGDTILDVLTRHVSKINKVIMSCYGN